LGGRLIGRVKPSIVIFSSTVVAAIGMFGLSFIDPRWTAIDIIIPMFIMAFGLGFGMAQRTNLVAVAVPHEDIGEASAILALVRNISGAFGTAIFSTLLISATNANVLTIARHSFLNGSGRQLTQEFIALITLKAQVSAYATVFEIASAVVLIGAFAAFFIRTPAEVMEDGQEVLIFD